MSRQDGRARRVSGDDVDDSGATILHVDLDAFFASVELLDHPELRGLPVIVGGREGRSVVTTATYEARAYGVGSAMPMARALQLCPKAIVLPPRHDLYRDYSARVMSIFDDITPTVERLSIDEAFLDVRGARRLLGRPAAIARLIRRRVADETGLTCSVGAAGTKFIAKLASGMAKPDGLLVVPPAQTLDFLHPLPIRALAGVGGKTEEALLRLGLRTVADVAEVPPSVLRSALGMATAERLHALASGQDPRSVVTERVEKSVGHEVTFHEDVTDEALLERELLRLSDRVGARLRAGGVAAEGVALKLRYSDFTTLNRSRRLPEPTNVARRLYESSLELFRELQVSGRPVRLIGVRAERLTDGAPSMSLWDPDEEWRDAENTVDALRGRFGADAVTAASLLSPRPSTAGGTRHPGQRAT
ncbi:DNA polymerase IV [Paramicrobacterium agarici]|uniref:DNA polymerase IV n=1 Tax=Paramicrobacterium agarici TaxID=630514 RepID=A0A2A9DZZ1_9MICO|nr:DNA polymerase IV [Microbacterium agarici]PFG31490.1 DNA polymerase-4 [Microbacterium agarici]TQO21378.1 DNA polymerase-4 [Microbacterium agarici]